jgi:hypothetical protein
MSKYKNKKYVPNSGESKIKIDRLVSDALVTSTFYLSEKKIIKSATAHEAFA